jgi:hypothetical protein
LMESRETLGREVISQRAECQRITSPHPHPPRALSHNADVRTVNPPSLA